MPPNRKHRATETRASRARVKKTNSLTCRNCRTRKIRCDGTLPSCGICQAYQEECLYDKAPPMSQILAMTKRIAELEKANHENEPISTNTVRESPVTTVSDVADATTSGSTGSGVLGISSRGDVLEGSAEIQTHVNAALGDHPLTSANAYFDTTSSVHVPETVLQQDQTPNTTASHSRSHATGERPRPMALVSNCSQVKFWEDRVVESGSIELHLPEQTVRHLLYTHWTWVHPAFMFVDKETFLRSAATGGEFYSPLLLSVLCLHSTRFTDHHLDEDLLARTKLLLGRAIHEESSIPLTQALLQQSAREIGRGNLSQAWMYSGMGFRMAIDLGLFTEAWRDHDGMSTERCRRNKVARQLSWSCFLWDKVMSLYFGRHPTLTEPPKIPFSFDASSDEAETWQPYDAEAADGRDYPPVPSYRLSCFDNFCKLGIIINDVLFNIYGKQQHNDVVDFVRATWQRLQTWRTNTPHALRIDISGSENWRLYCPPQHILTQNMLYYTTIILLYRPFRSNTPCRSICREAAEGVENLLLRIEQTFGLSRCTYAMAYCSYTAATVAVQDTKDEVPGAQRRLDTYLRALNALSRSCPGIQRGIDIIHECLAAGPTSIAVSKPQNPSITSPPTTRATTRTATSSTSAHGITINPPSAPQSPQQQMPAFPFSYGMPTYDGHGADGYDPTQIMHPHMLSHLDSYPQDWLSMSNDVQNSFDMEYFGLDGPL